MSRVQQIGSAITHVPLTEPDDISGLVYWFKSTDGITLNGTDVSAWADQSGNGYNMTAPATSNEPAYGAATGANSFPGVTFDGVGNALEMANPAFTAITTAHIFMVYESVTWTNNRYIIASSSDDTEGSVLQQGTGTETKMYSGAGGSAGNTISPTDDADHYIEALFTGSTSDSLRFDGNAAVTGTNAGTLNYTGLLIGGSSDGGGFSNIIMTEIFAYSAELTGSDLTNIRTYINDRYGIDTTP